jgi:hypothetical protein
VFLFLSLGRLGHLKERVKRQEVTGQEREEVYTL